jgi:hypothetical protein
MSDKKKTSLPTEKQTKPSTEPSATELPPIVIELLRLKKAGQPVLLHGGDNDGLEYLIKEVHLNSGGIDAYWEYKGSEENINNLSALNTAMIRAVKEQDIDKIYELLGGCRDTTNTWRRVNCHLMSGKEVYNILLEDFYKYALSEDFEMFKKRGLVYSCCDYGEDFIPAYEEQKELYKIFKEYIRIGSFDWRLLYENGLLFIDFLICRKDQLEDEFWYTKLAKEIEERQKKLHTSGNWLVAYAYEYENFPQCFLDQFERVSLDGENAVVVSVKDIEPAEEQAWDNEFLLSVNTWKISYNGNTITLQDSKGLRYIHCLLTNPGNEFHVLELVREIEESKPSKGIYNNLIKEEQEGHLREEGVYKGLTKNTGDVLDTEGLRLLKEKYENLESELNDEEAPPSDDRTSEIEKEKEGIVKLITAGRDKFGRPRKFPAEAEKARKAVSKAYKESLKKIESAHPTLIKHFKNTIRMGIYCSYKPETSIPWKL